MTYTPGDEAAEHQPSMRTLERIEARYQALVWHVGSGRVGPIAGLPIRAARIAEALVRDLASGTLSLQAMSLVYTTLLSLVPLLAVSFSVLKAFGVHNQIEPALLRFLAPLGADAMEITQRVIGFVDNMKVGVLGSLGIALLLYTVVSTVQKIEEALNRIWHVARERSFFQRFGRYVSVILVGPVLLFAALGVSASVMSTTLMQEALAIRPLGELIGVAGKIAPVILITAAFAFVYVFVPNTRVRLLPAVSGALVAAVLWESAGWLFARFIVGSTNYAAIYSGFAILILFMIWVYAAWLIVLSGASIAFYAQHPEYLSALKHRGQLSSQQRDEIALEAAFRVASGHLLGSEPGTADQLASDMALPLAQVTPALSALVDIGVLARNDENPPRYLLSRAPERIGLFDLLTQLRRHAEGGDSAHRIPLTEPVAGFLSGMDRVLQRELGDRSLRDLLPDTSTTESAPGSRTPAGVEG